MREMAVDEILERSAPGPAGEAGRVSFQVEPGSYRHWRLTFDGPVATLAMDVDERGGLRDGYELKLNSYDLGVDIELYDAVQRLRFEHPEVRTVVITSGKPKIFCAGANIRMLAASPPELPLLGVLPGTGGLTRVSDKRHVRRDLADYFSTKAEGIGGKKAVQWRLVDEAVPRPRWDETVAERAAELAARSSRPHDAEGVALTALNKTRDDDAITYDHVEARLDRDTGKVDISVKGPQNDPPAKMAEARSADFWP